MKQNAMDHALDFPLAAKAVNEEFYVDDGITGADSIPEAIYLQRQLLQLLGKAKFLLRKWNYSEPTVLKAVDIECG